jgi:UDP-N-acetylglucosamine diphosphorylase/glucosamine-1-phosphate N-acetyltransferase
MAIILFDNAVRDHFYPFTQTRAIAGLRMGIVTIRERWSLWTREPVYVHTTRYLRPLYETPAAGPHWWIDATVLPSAELLRAISELEEGSCLADEYGLIAGKAQLAFEAFDPSEGLRHFKEVRRYSSFTRIRHPWHLVEYNDFILRQDFSLLVEGRRSQPIPATNRVSHPEAIFIEEGASIEHCIINATTGPVYIGKDATLMEGSAIRGPFSLGHGAVIKMNSRIYGATTIGPWCLGGGEIKNSILMGYSNKAHDGYLGDSAVGEWCNFGAGATNSNVKNTAGVVQVWDELSGTFVPASQKCGVFMGDYSRVAINASINTGSVIGVSCNVFGNGLLPKRIKDFSWGTEGEVYELDKALEDIGNWKKMKQQMFTGDEASVLAFIFAHHSK